MHLQYSRTQRRDGDMTNLVTKILSQGFIEITMTMQEDLKVSGAFLKSVMSFIKYLYIYMYSVVHNYLSIDQVSVRQVSTLWGAKRMPSGYCGQVVFPAMGLTWSLILTCLMGKAPEKVSVNEIGKNSKPWPAQGKQDKIWELFVRSTC